MNRARLAVGLVVGFGVLAIVIVVLRRVRRRLVPTWRGPEAVLADVILVVALVTVVSDVLGAMGRFAAWPLLIAMLVASAALWRLGVPRTPTPTSGPPARQHPTASAGAPSHAVLRGGHAWEPYAVGAAVATVAAMWLSELPRVYQRGIFEWDSLWYHLPIAATLARTGAFLPMKLYDADIVVSTYPAGAEVFHALGMVVTRSDVMSPLLNIAWAIVFVLAAHVFGQRFAVGHAATVVALTVLAFPTMVQFEAVSALSEVMSLACMAAAMAFVVVDSGTHSADSRNGTSHGADRSVGPLILTGLAVGLMASTKLVMLGPAVVLMAGVLVIEWRRGRARFRRPVIAFVASALATGGFWYIRNIVRFGNPIPAIHLGVGSWTLPSIQPAGTFLPMLPTLIKGAGTTGLSTATFGGVSFVILVVPLAVCIAAMTIRKSVELVVFAFVGFAMYAIGLMTPQYARNGVYLNLFSNGRYLLAGLAASLLVAVGFVALEGRARRALLPVVLGIFVFTALEYLVHPYRIVWWGAHAIGAPWVWVAALIIACTGFVALYTTWRTRRRSITRAGLAAIGLASVALVLFSLPSYLSGRYRRDGVSTSVYTWAQRHPDRTIAVAPYDFADFAATQDQGFDWLQRAYALLITYPLYGRDGSNRVEPVASFDGKRVVRPATCAQWWSELRRIGATEVMVWDPGRVRPQSRYVEWTTDAAATRLVAVQPIGRRPGASLKLYQVDPDRSPRCT